MTKLLTMDYTIDESIQEIIYECDIAIQYGEFLEPREGDYEMIE